MRPASALLLIGAAYLGWRYLKKPAAPPADRMAPVLEPEVVTDKTIDAASQFATGGDASDWIRRALGVA